MFKIAGLDKLQKDLKDAERAIERLDGEITEIHFNPSDSSSISDAVRTMERSIDQRLAPYRNNPLVAEMVKVIKAHYRASILERAREAGG